MKEVKNKTNIKEHVITLYWYIFKEILPQFITSLCILSGVIVVSQLIRLSSVLVNFGISLETVLLPFLFILLPFLSFTIPISYLYGVLLGVGRLSADGEYTAMLASGFSLSRVMRPVLILGFALYLFASYAALYFEPWGRRESELFFHRQAQTQLDNIIKVQMKPKTFVNDFLGFVIYAEEISADKTKFKNVLLAPGKGNNSQKFTLLAPKGGVIGSVKKGDLKMLFQDGVILDYGEKKASSVVNFKELELDILRIFQERILGSEAINSDYRGFGPIQLWNYVSKYEDEIEDKGSIDKLDAQSKRKYLKSRYLLHSRFGTPFATIIFALFGLVLAIQDDRKGRGSAYVGSLLTIVTGYVFVMSFKFLAEKGVIAAPVGVWFPNIVMLSFAGFLVYQKDRLPASESTLDPRYFPKFMKFNHDKKT